MVSPIDGSGSQGPVDNNSTPTFQSLQKDLESLLKTLKLLVDGKASNSDISNAHGTLKGNFLKGQKSLSPAQVKDLREEFAKGINSLIDAAKASGHEGASQQLEGIKQNLQAALEDPC